MSAAFLAVSGTLGGCLSCMFFVESIAKEEPGAMNLFTFATFLFTSLEGLIFTSRFLTVKNKIPIKGYLPSVTLFFLVNVINNQALNFHVPVPLHIIFRSGSLLASLLMSKLLQKRKYSMRKYISVFMITVGIIICTLATSRIQKTVGINAEEAAKHYKEWLIGIAMLIAALLASAYMAICQEQMYVKYGKYSREAMFYVHAISLPFFAFMGKDIMAYAKIFSASSPMSLFGCEVPHMWVLLLAACVLQWVCIRFVYLANSELESLSVTMVVTLRKFLSLLISILWFRNPFTLTHWIGAVLVFSGTLFFADIWDFKSSKKKKLQ